MNFTEEQKQHAINLIEQGEKIQAIKYLRESLNITLEQALTLAEKLEQEVEGKPVDITDLSHKKTKVNPPKLVGTIFMSIGVIMLVVTIWIYNRQQQFYNRAIPVQGTVISYTQYESDGDDGGSTTMYTPMFEYSYNGQTYTQPGEVSSSSRSYDIGEPVEIMVDPDNPSDMMVDSFMERWFVVLLLGFLGTLFTGIGYVAFRVA